MKVKYIDEKDRVTDEWYTNFYVCPYCDHRSIIAWFNFCPNCGKRVYWKSTGRIIRDRKKRKELKTDKPIFTAA